MTPRQISIGLICLAATATIAQTKSGVGTPNTNSPDTVACRSKIDTAYKQVTDAVNAANAAKRGEDDPELKRIETAATNLYKKQSKDVMPLSECQSTVDEFSLLRSAVDKARAADRAKTAEARPRIEPIKNDAKAIECVEKFENDEKQLKNLLQKAQQIANLSRNGEVLRITKSVEGSGRAKRLLSEPSECVKAQQQMEADRQSLERMIAMQEAKATTPSAPPLSPLATCRADYVKAESALRALFEKGLAERKLVQADMDKYTARANERRTKVDNGTPQQCSAAQSELESEKRMLETRQVR